MRSILPRARKPCHSERSETASSLQPSAPHSVIPSASEESWLSSNPAESHETRRKTPKAAPDHSERSEPTPSCHSERSEESRLSSNPAEAHETRRKTSKAPPDHSERGEPAPPPVIPSGRRTPG